MSTNHRNQQSGQEKNTIIFLEQAKTETKRWRKFLEKNFTMPCPDCRDETSQLY